jgi:prepilin-type processing-associated H-X9-DG protein
VPIIISCDCGKAFQARDEDLGRRVLCPSCGREQVVPKPAYHAGDELANALMVQPRTSGKAIASLVLGLFSFCCSIFTGIPGLILGILGLSEIENSKGMVTGRGLAITGIVTSAIGCTFVFLAFLIALLLPAVQAAREAARRVQCVNNLKQIGLAMHNFNSSNDHFPPAAITGPEGKPLLSWRVAILPYIEQQELYNQFHLDEPWDSPHNMALLGRRPRTYACPSSGDIGNDATLTTYQVLVGPGTMFEDGKGTSIASIRDGTSNTLLVVESDDPIPWTQPEDLHYDPKAPLPPMGSKHPGGFNALFADGSVKFLKKSIVEEVFRAWITRSGGEVVGPGD